MLLQIAITKLLVCGRLITRKQNRGTMRYPSYTYTFSSCIVLFITISLTKFHLSLDEVDEM
ncbi:hypothetical protein KSB_34300 [Ktedonobacter robiniae]|uniref:Uncharacterized protein n=1 Tax=Ktedonobacter robiniae TaxID=2778365 RepID=A0ABQ3URG2_9CHLR|nr:hypothetical protein KSB_34300 [Ktedonobacter robiniae]